MTDPFPRKISLAPPHGAFEPMAPERVTAGAPAARLDNAYSSADGHFDAGVWESEPGRWRVHYTEHEVCVLVAGRIRLIGADGRAVEYSSGDTFVIPAGFDGEWETLERARKLYVIYQP